MDVLPCAVGDLFLTRADSSAQRFYSLSSQIQRERKEYYEVLDRTQKGSLDVTDWLSWFSGVLSAMRSLHLMPCWSRHASGNAGRVRQ